MKNLAILYYVQTYDLVLEYMYKERINRVEKLPCGAAYTWFMSICMCQDHGDNT
jgi:hypothetical protein